LVEELIETIAYDQIALISSAGGNLGLLVSMLKSQFFMVKLKMPPSLWHPRILTRKIRYIQLATIRAVYCYFSKAQKKLKSQEKIRMVLMMQLE